MGAVRVSPPLLEITMRQPSYSVWFNNNTERTLEKFDDFDDIDVAVKCMFAYSLEEENSFMLIMDDYGDIVKTLFSSRDRVGDDSEGTGILTDVFGCVTTKYVIRNICVENELVNEFVVDR